MTWQQAKKVLVKELAQLRSPKQQGVPLASIPAHPDRLVLKKELIEQEQTWRKRVDQACQTFSTTRTWPELEAEELLFLTHRFALALSFLRFLEAEHQSVRIVLDPVSEIPDWRILEFLLVDYWHWIGHQQYLFELTHLL